jgi:NAD(P)-dependent dehydrogenase (short-subunit alcohol dehydrogenase family)
VVLHARRAGADLEATADCVRGEGRRAWCYPADLEDADGTADFARRVTEDREISILVNNAAVRPQALLEEVTAAEWQRVIRVNLTAAFELIQACAPGMRRRGWGRIINVGGQDAQWGWGGRAHVVASKSGLAGLTRCLAVELGPDGVTVNQVSPGLIRTARPTAGYPDWQLVEDRMRSVMAIKRIGEVDDVAATVAFLASPAAGYITGQEMHVNGGGFPLLPNPRGWGVGPDLPRRPDVAPDGS